MLPGSPRSSLSARRVLACLSVVGAGLTVAVASDLPVTIRAHARALAPGEPLRIEVVSDAPLESARAEFLGSDVFLAPIGGATRWLGWAMVDLDQPAGTQAIEVRGRTADGRAVAGTHAVTIERRDFPTEELSVAPRYVEPPAEVQERLARERKRLAAIYALRSEPGGTLEPFVRPVPGAPTSVFGTRRVFNGEPRSPHPGLDLRAARGTEVRSAGAGRVALADDLYYAGNTVLIDHGGGLFTIYAHLSAILVEPEQQVERGQPIGRSGSTGRVTGPHLHWGAKVGARPFDPTALLDPALF